ncbi:MAG: DUF1080 domain-containing protein [Flavobacteriaceae bacterium]
MKSISIIFLVIGFISCNSDPIDSNTEEWMPLFNGKDLTDWKIKMARREVGVNYKNTFRVEDDMIRIVYEDYDVFENDYGHMYYKTPFSHYKLRFEYRFLGEQTSGGENWNVRNSGIMLHSQSAESNAFEQHFPVSIELQLLGGLGTVDRTTGNLCTPGTAVVFQNELDFTHCISASSKTYHGDQWVKAEAIVLGSESIIHIIENDTVLSYSQPQIDQNFISKDYQGSDWDMMGVTNYEYWKSKAGTLIDQGYIALQAESHSIDFKNIELLNLCGCMDKTAKNFKSYYIKADNSSCVYN